MSQTADIEVRGTVAPGFEGVRDAFLENFAHGLEIGAACSLWIEGEEKVSIAGGETVAGGGEPYDVDTLQLVFSSTKGLVAMCANLLAQRGELDVDALVTDVWPEYGGAGKQDTKIEWLLTHQAGVPIIDAPLTLEEVLSWDPVIEAIGEQEPQWVPGTAHGYHAVSYGWLVGEVIRRVTGKTVGAFFAEEIAGPLGLETWIGLPHEHFQRVAPFGELFDASDPEAQAMVEAFLGPDMPIGRALYGPGGVFREEGLFNRPDVLAAEIPAANGVTTASSLAKAYAACIGEVDGVRILTPEQVEEARRPRTEGNDRILVFESKIGLGFFAHSSFSPYGGPQSFGHTGLGGSCGFADPENGVAFGYAMNNALANLAGDPRTRRLIEAGYAAIGVEPAPY
jgi:CubicO group peptidase (beta-lactamase class C family)